MFMNGARFYCCWKKVVWAIALASFTMACTHYIPRFGIGGKYEEGKAQFLLGRSGDMDVAITALETVVKENPKYDDSLTYLGRAYYRKGRYFDAFEILQRALAVNKDDEIAWIAIGLTQLRLGQNEKGIETLKVGNVKTAAKGETVFPGVQSFTDNEVFIDVQEIRKAETSAQLVAENVATQLERRVAFRRAMKKALSTAMKFGAKGIRIRCSGRLGGSEMSRVETYREGRVPLHTLRADIEFGMAEARTKYGIIGIKCWIFKGEVLPRRTRRPIG